MTKKWTNGTDDGELPRVVLGVDRRLQDVAASQERSTSVLENAISATEALLLRSGHPLPSCPSAHGHTTMPSIVRDWDALLAEAEATITEPVGLTDLLTDEEIRAVESRLDYLREDFNASHRLDAIDWSIAGVAGTLAALVDTFLVKMPSSGGVLGGGATKGGPLSDYIRQRLRASVSPEELRVLERDFAVPYDASRSSGLAIPISGLGPRTHRFQSLGHDPILGFLFGTLDILRGSMTAVDASGKLIQQATREVIPRATLFEALGRQLGHLVSDVSTSAGLPAPLMPLLQFVRAGDHHENRRSLVRLSGSCT